MKQSESKAEQECNSALVFCRNRHIAGVNFQFLFSRPLDNSSHFDNWWQESIENAPKLVDRQVGRRPEQRENQRNGMRIYLDL